MQPFAVAFYRGWRSGVNAIAQLSSSAYTRSVGSRIAAGGLGKHSPQAADVLECLHFVASGGERLHKEAVGHPLCRARRRSLRLRPRRREAARRRPARRSRGRQATARAVVRGGGALPRPRARSRPLGRAGVSTAAAAVAGPKAARRLALRSATSARSMASAAASMSTQQSSGRRSWYWANPLVRTGRTGSGTEPMRVRSSLSNALRPDSQAGGISSGQTTEARSSRETVRRRLRTRYAN